MTIGCGGAASKHSGLTTLRPLGNQASSTGMVLSETAGSSPLKKSPIDWVTVLVLPTWRSTLDVL